MTGAGGALLAVACALAVSWTAARAQGPNLAMVIPQSRKWVAVDDQPVSMAKSTRAGSRVTAAEDGVARLGIPDAAGGTVTLLGAVDEVARMGVGGTDYSERRIFSLDAGAALVSAATATENIRLVAAGRTLTLQHAVCLVRVKQSTLIIMVTAGAAEIPTGSGTPPLIVTAGQWVTLPPGTVSARPAAFIWPGVLEEFGLGRQGRALSAATIGASSGGPAGRPPFPLRFLYIALFLLHLARVVYPKFGDRAVVAACVGLLVESQLELSRQWLKVYDTPFPAGAFVLGILVLRWVVAEEESRWGLLSSPRSQVISHVSKCVLIWVLALLVNHGALVFNTQTAQNVVRLPRAQVTAMSQDISPVVTTPSQQELVGWEALAMILPGLMLLVR